MFAPIDRSLRDLLGKAKSRSINLIELAKHHIGKCPFSSRFFDFLIFCLPNQFSAHRAAAPETMRA